jgi:2-polyprenyl-3-methyl-5-hydroxy-6-metoxy-1,4-benzoquinol methylase
MMPLTVRSSEPERMDTDCRDYADYAHCLRDLSRVNVVTLTHRAMLRWLARCTVAMPAFSLLDVACGYGDALRLIRRRFPQARLTGIDLNPWAIKAASEATDAVSAIRFINGDVFSYTPDENVDFIVTSQFTHHLTDPEVVVFLRWLTEHATRGWFISDVQRNVFAYVGFPVLAHVCGWHRFVRLDGRTSIARSFRPRELRELLVQAGLNDVIPARVFPFRLCASLP